MTAVDLFTAAADAKEEAESITVRIRRQDVEDIVILNMATGEDCCLYVHDGEDRAQLQSGGDLVPATLRQAQLVVGCRAAYVGSWPCGEARQFELARVDRLFEELIARADG